MKLNEKTWEDMEKPKCILLSVNRQTKKASYGMIPIVWRSGKDKTMVAARKMSGYKERISRRSTEDF